jgi:hypothetical protein
MTRWGRPALGGVARPLWTGDHAGGGTVPPVCGRTRYVFPRYQSDKTFGNCYNMQVRSTALGKHVQMGPGWAATRAVSRVPGCWDARRQDMGHSRLWIRDRFDQGCKALAVLQPRHFGARKDRSSVKQPYRLGRRRRESMPTQRSRLS